MAKTEYAIEPGKHDMFITRVFDAPRELVFKAFTDPELFAQWWGPRRYTNVIDKFDYAGQVDRDAFLATETLEEQFGQGRIDKPEPRKREYPLQLNIIDFPG